MTPLIHLMLILAAWALCQALPRKMYIPVLTVMGALAIGIFAPVALIFILVSSLEAALLVRLLVRLDRGSGLRKWGLYALLPNLLFVDFNALLLGMPVATLAISFSLIRIFMTARQILTSRKGFDRSELVWIFAAAFYLPAIVIGPVFAGQDLRKQHRAADWPAPTLRDARMVLQGLVLSIVVAAWFFRYADVLLPPLTAVFLFLSLFAAFWGQSLIAEHSSRFFGIHLPVNFDHPWKARSIKDFWQRWHRSMAQFVLQYIYLPLNLRGLNPRLATVAAFAFMGVWHNVSAGYLVWGICHGLLLVYAPEPDDRRLRNLIIRVGTWIAVISLSWFANYGPWS